jgi:uncharacterized protein YbaR (Trm112 family)
MNPTIRESTQQQLVCPVCKGALRWLEHDAPPCVECEACGRLYPFHDGIPVLLRERATVGNS